ncbi:hypothetical protein SAMN05421505_12431 [Sinosporangium album]|uniref:ODP domain-containing protein n=1 Tax=Sinosporangium album TaxID=504805 RepID=A0A1G8FPH3_9ACTN|nr:hypothetical protein [Sinosporangium album]SDH84073.1 hypothetical protein SAMN05421505_12431 [Sinosporangium album]
MPREEKPATPPVPLVPESLYAMGSAFQADGRVSWLPKHTTGWQATNAYAIVTPDRTTLIDPGPRYQGELVASQLLDLVPSDTSINICLTRAERDVIGAIDSVGRSFPIERLVAGGIPNLFDGFESLASVKSGGHSGFVQMSRMPNGSAIPIGDDRELIVLAPMLRVLSTFWFYDAETGSLFTSDSFDHLLADTFEEARLPCSEPSKIWSDPTAVDDHLLAKFWWLEGAALAPVRSDLEKLFGERTVNRICPTHGRVIEGAEHVAAAYEAIQSALSRLDEGSLTRGAHQ